MTERRYYVHDRQQGQHADLSRWSYVNPRYFVMDRDTGQVADEATTKRLATEIAADLNQLAREAIAGQTNQHTNQ